MLNIPLEIILANCILASIAMALLMLVVYSIANWFVPPIAKLQTAALWFFGISIVLILVRTIIMGIPIISKELQVSRTAVVFIILPISIFLAYKYIVTDKKAYGALFIASLIMLVLILMI